VQPLHETGGEGPRRPRLLSRHDGAVVHTHGGSDGRRMWRRRIARGDPARIAGSPVAIHTGVHGPRASVQVEPLAA
jgi:hypothetical protein